MQYVRKIFYMDLYDGDNKVKNCGFVKMEVRSSKTYFYFCLSDLPDMPVEELTANLDLEKEKIAFEHLKVKNSSVCEVVMLNKRIVEQQIVKIYVKLSGQKQVQFIRKSKVESTSNPIMATSVNKDSESVMLESKWEQLKQMFPVLSIFGEDAETILLNPKDLIVLPEEYHYLATNSFLMHAFYNYRQLLLIRWGDQGEYRYYIGVPGTYYDREKSVARMFGFEGFENGESSRRELYAATKSSEDNQIYPGCFGYYMKRVSI